MVKKFEEKLLYRKKERNLCIAKLLLKQGKSYYVYSAIDVERNELIYVYTTKLSDYEVLHQ